MKNAGVIVTRPWDKFSFLLIKKLCLAWLPMKRTTKWKKSDIGLDLIAMYVFPTNTLKSVIQAPDSSLLWVGV